MEVGQPPCAAHALVTARVAGWRAVVGCVRWSAWKPMEAFKTPGEVVHQALVGQGEGLGGRGRISGEMGEV